MRRPICFLLDKSSAPAKDMSSTSAKIATIDAGPANILITVLTLMHFRKNRRCRRGAGYGPSIRLTATTSPKSLTGKEPTGSEHQIRACLMKTRGRVRKRDERQIRKCGVRPGLAKERWVTTARGRRGQLQRQRPASSRGVGASLRAR